MFGRKKQIEIAENTTDLKEYISIDSIKAHMVNILEENRDLKKAQEKEQTEHSKSYESLVKQKEVLQITADEYNKRLKEAEREISNLKYEIKKVERSTSAIEKERNDAIVSLEMQKSELEKLRNSDIQRKREIEIEFSEKLIKIVNDTSGSWGKEKIIKIISEVAKGE